MPFAPSVQTQEVPRDFNLDDYVDGEDSEAEETDIRQTRKLIFLIFKYEFIFNYFTKFIERHKLENMGVL
jgi:hypothetical protein